MASAVHSHNRKSHSGPLLIGIWMLLSLSLFNIAHAGGNHQVTYRLKWLVNMSTVGDILALGNGCFKAQGLDVILKEGGPERDAIRELELGYAHFGVASGDQVIQAIAKGSPVVVVAQLFQKNPLQWVYFKERLRIDGPTSLRDKTIGVTFGKNDEIIMRTLLAKSGIPIREVRLYSVRMDYTPFFKGVADLWPVYINTQAVEIGERIKTAGASIGFLDPEAYGVTFVANSVVTSLRQVEQNPHLVQRFVDALREGWAHSLDATQNQHIIKSVRRYDQDTPDHLLAIQLERTRGLVKPDGAVPVGHIDASAWEQTEKIMLANGQIDRPVGIERYLRSEFVQ